MITLIFMSRFGARTRSRRVPGTHRPFLGLIAGGVLVVAGLAHTAPANAETAATDPAHTHPAHAAATTQIITWEQTMLWGEPFQEVKKHLCPVGLRLSNTQYHPNWRVPNGLEIFQSKVNSRFGADIWPHWSDGFRGGPQIGVGGFASTVSNWLGEAQTVRFVMHCVADG